MPTRCNRGFYCRSYCLLNMFRAPLCPSSRVQEYYTVVAACGISCCGFSSSWSGVELRVMCPVCRMLQHPASNKICNKTSVASSWHFISTYCQIHLLPNRSNQRKEHFFFCLKVPRLRPFVLLMGVLKWMSVEH